MEWFKDQAFWEKTYPYMFYKETFERAEQEVDKILSLVDPKGNLVLDLCCGPGRHSIALSKAKFQVTGVDITPFLLSKAEEAAKKAQLKIKWICQDMREYIQLEQFHLIVNLWSSFGYFAHNENKLVLQNIYKSLRNGGILVMDLLGKEIIARDFKPVTLIEFPGDTRLVERLEISADWGKTNTEWMLIQGEKVSYFHFELIVYSAWEIKSLLKKAGFSEVQIYGDLDGNNYDTGAKRLVVVAHKLF